METSAGPAVNYWRLQRKPPVARGAGRRDHVGGEWHRPVAATNAAHPSLTAAALASARWVRLPRSPLLGGRRLACPGARADDGVPAVAAARSSPHAPLGVMVTFSFTGSLGSGIVTSSTPSCVVALIFLTSTPAGSRRLR